MGQDPKILICPADERQQAIDFAILNFHTNLNVSYFVGAYAHDNYLKSFFGGDRNMASTSNNNSYGYSPADGRGFDTATIPLRTNTTNIFWSRKMHTEGKTVGAGNLLIGDGSVQQVTSGGLRNMLQQCEDAGTRSNGVVRLLLP